MPAEEDLAPKYQRDFFLTVIDPLEPHEISRRDVLRVRQLRTCRITLSQRARKFQAHSDTLSISLNTFLTGIFKQTFST